MRRDDLETKEADVDENGLTMKEERELKWAQENEEEEMAGVDKVAMRAYYKVRAPRSIFVISNADSCAVDSRSETRK